LAYARFFLRRTRASERPQASATSIGRAVKYLIPAGIISILAAFAWLPIAFRFAGDTPTGALVIFLPCFALLSAGIAALAARVYIWLN